MKERIIKKTKIGGFIALGGEHLVMAYGSDCVIKIPFGLRYFLRPRQYTGRIQDDYDILKKYFGDYFIETEVRVNKKKDWYALVQRKYAGRVLTKKDLDSDPNIKAQFLEIVSLNKKLTEERNITWDFFGAWCFVFSSGTTIANIILEDGKLKMADIGLIYLNNKNAAHWLIKAIVGWAIKKQKRFLKNLIG